MDNEKDFNISEEPITPSSEYHRKGRKKVLRNIILSLILVIGVAAVLFIFFFPLVQVSGSSMEPTLHTRDVLITRKAKSYEKGDIIVFTYNDQLLVKRIIAKSGDIVNIEEDGTVSVNDAVLEEPYVSEKALGQCNIIFPYQVPEGKLFVLGDQRAFSVDSRKSGFGCIHQDAVTGKVFFRLFPLASFGSMEGGEE